LTIYKCPNSPSRSIDDQQRETLSNVIYSQSLYGRYDFAAFTREDTNTFVEYGFARHRGSKPAIDEPLAILAAMAWFDLHPNFFMSNCLRRDMYKPSHRHNGFEAYLTFYLRQVFKYAEKLDMVFTFRVDLAPIAWQHSEFELVTVVDAMCDKPQVSVVTPTSGPSSNLGVLAKLVEVSQWITTNRDHFTFCFPPEAFGPDLLFFLRHKESGRLLLVAIQAKNYEVVNRPILMKGIRTVAPSWFWKSKDMKVCSFIQTVCICFD
jgi:hypothetical protein